MSSSCLSIKELTAPYVDGELAQPDADSVERHLQACLACRARVATEQAVRALLSDRRTALRGECASSALRARCRALVPSVGEDAFTRAPRTTKWRSRLAPLAAAAVLVVIVGSAFLY